MVGVVLVEKVSESVVRQELWPLYRSVFDDFEDVETWREQVWERHAARTGFRLALARDGDARTGFAYGYTGARGQWWTDSATKVLHPAAASDWLGGHFELVSIGVEAPARGSGGGRQLMAALTEGLAQPRWVLMTSSDVDDPARRLYRSADWAVIGPGLSPEQVIMGRAWPTPSDAISAAVP